MDNKDNNSDKNIDNVAETQNPAENISEKVTPDNVSSEINTEESTDINDSDTKDNVEENNITPQNEAEKPADNTDAEVSNTNTSITEEKQSAEIEADNKTETESNSSATISDDTKSTEYSTKDAPPVVPKSKHRHVPRHSEKKEKTHRNNRTSVEKNRIVKSTKEPEYLPGMQRKLFVDVRDEDSLTFTDKIKAILKDTSSIFSIVIYVLIVANLIGITLFTKKCGLNITQSLLYKIHIDTLTFDTYTFLEISIVLSYIFAFIFGGLVTFAMVKIASLIAKNIGAVYSHNFTRIIFGIFIVVFAIFTITSYISSGGMLTIATQNWFLPLSVFAGGLCMYCISLRNVEIY